ncbi:MAG: ABC transporter substrate-binding protein [Sphaerochaetaceae bacterium]
MKLKKMLALLLLLIASTGLIFAQGAAETTTQKGPTVVTFWSLFTGGDGEFFDAMIDEFNATHTDIQMKTDTVKFDSYYTKLTAALAAGTAPDLVVVHEANIRNYVPDQLLALDPYLEENNFPVDDFVSAPLEACKFDGQYYAIPLDVHPIIMYANTALLKQAGINDLPTNYEELIADAKAVQDKTGAMGIACDNTTAVYKAYTLTRLFFSMMYEQDGQMLSDDNMSAAFNNEYGVKALVALQDMVNKYEVTPQGLDYDSSVNAFKLGQAAFHFNGVWATGTFEKADNLDFVAVALPGLIGKPAAWGGSHTLAIPATEAKDPDHVKDILTCIDWITAHGEMWSLAGHIPTRTSVQESDAFKALPYRAGYASAAASTVAPPATDAWSEIYTTLSDKLEYAVAHNSNPQMALDDMEKTVNKIIMTY